MGALVAITAVAVQIMAADADGCSSSSSVKLTVAAAPEIAPAVQEAAAEWSKANPDVNGKCIQVEVRRTAPADLAGSLATRSGGHIDVAAKPAPTPSESDIPAVWIPDSTSWLARVTAVDRSAFGTLAPPVAMSPVVFAMPETAARAIAPKLGNAGAQGLLQAVLVEAQKVIQAQQANQQQANQQQTNQQQANQQPRAPELTVHLVDPRRDTASLGGAMLIRDAVVTDETKVPNLIALYRLINRGRVADPESLRKALGQGPRVAPMAEQAVAAFNAANPPAPLAAIPLPAGGPALDYPYATLSGNSREVDAAAAKFRAALTGTQYRDAFAKRGFRSVDGTAGAGFPVGHGVTARPVNATPLGDLRRVGQTLGYWSAANAPSRALALIDVSSSMGLPLGVTTRIEVLQRAAITGLALFNDTSSLGMWAFDSSHRELAPIMQLTAQNRAQLNRRILSVRPSPSDDSALFLTLRDAYRTMTDSHNPEVMNRIIVFTDGKSSGTGVKSFEQLNRELEYIAVVTKPIEVTLIGVGPDVDMAELKEIARITGGVAVQILNPAEIQRVFLRALLE